MRLCALSGGAYIQNMLYGHEKGSKKGRELHYTAPKKKDRRRKDPYLYDAMLHRDPEPTLICSHTASSKLCSLVQLSEVFRLADQHRENKTFVSLQNGNTACQND